MCALLPQKNPIEIHGCAAITSALPSTRAHTVQTCRVFLYRVFTYRVFPYRVFPYRVFSSSSPDPDVRWKGQNQRAGLKLIVAEGCWGASWGGSAAHSQVGSTPGRTCPALSGPRPVCSVSSEGHRGCPCPGALSWLPGRCLLWGGSRGVWLQPGLFLLLLKPWWARCHPGLLLREGGSTPKTARGFHPAS